MAQTVSRRRMPAFLGGLFKHRAAGDAGHDHRLAWDDSLSVHVAKIDEQHKVLVGLVNELDDSIRQGRDRKVVGSVLESLIEYTQTHFASEEDSMVLYRYPTYARHKSEHDMLTSKVLDLRQHYREGTAVVGADVLRFLRTWLVGHIQGMDKVFGNYLNGQGVH